MLLKDKNIMKNIEDNIKQKLFRDKLNLLDNSIKQGEIFCNISIISIIIIGILLILIVLFKL